jgi:hypothetical protein
VFYSREVHNFSYSVVSRQALGPTQPHIQWVPRDLSPGVKGSKPEAENSPPYNSKVKNSGAVARVEAKSNTSTVILRVVGGDEKESLKSETVKYGREPHGTRTRE